MVSPVSPFNPCLVSVYPGYVLRIGHYLLLNFKSNTYANKGCRRNLSQLIDNMGKYDGEEN
jgi:hypothetical protein